MGPRDDSRSVPTLEGFCLGKSLMRLCIVAGLIPSSNEIVQMHLYTPIELDNGRVNKR